MSSFCHDLAAGAVGDDEVPDDDLADIVVLRHEAADQGVGLVDEDDLYGAEVTGGTAGLVNLHNRLLVKFLKETKREFYYF